MIHEKDIWDNPPPDGEIVEVKMKAKGWHAYTVFINGINISDSWKLNEENSDRWEERARRTVNLTVTHGWYADGNRLKCAYCGKGNENFAEATETPCECRV